ncbi:MAG: hypothetical protein F6K00_22055 [Leptolyngbya sp. SIOISBB]|nr:hypothetical protein [Leptolyngbya sp. SIOISBB]
MSFDNIQTKDRAAIAHHAPRLSLDGKVTAVLGDDSRGDKTRRDVRVSDHDMRTKEK